MDLEQLKYPIGQFKKPAAMTAELLTKYISDIEVFPSNLKKETARLSDEQLNKPYRQGGWSIRQVVNHCADSHMNSMIRFKLALTEDRPTIKGYFEDRWAELEDSKTIHVDSALKLLEGLHERWVILLRSLTGEQLQRVFIHPEQSREISIEENIGAYAWHCNHHLAQIMNIKKQMSWNKLD